MRGKILVLATGLVVLWLITAWSSPVDHVYISNQQIDKLNLDGSLDKNFRSPNSDNCRILAVDGTSGNVWLGCQNTNNIYIFSSDGTLSNQCLGCGNMAAGCTMCIDPYGNGWFGSAASTGSIRKFSPTATLINSYSTGGSLSRAVACDRFGNVWTANSGSDNVSKLNSGSLIGTYSGPLAASQIAVDQFDNVWIGGNDAFVRKLSNNGSFLGDYPVSDTQTGLAIDNAGNVWVSLYNIVTKLSSTGVNLGNFSVTNPWSIAIDASGNVWVVQPVNYTVTKLSNNGTNLGSFPLSGTTNSGQNDTGFLYQRFVLGYDTVEGPNVWVPINGGAPSGAVALTFDTVTTKGNTTYTTWGSGSEPHYEIITTAVYSGSM